MPARQTSTEQAIDERPATRSQGPADEISLEDKKRTATQAGVNKNDPVPEKRSKSEGSDSSTTERSNLKDGRRQGHQPHESIKEILEDEDYELVSERTNKYGNSTLIFMDKNSGYHATYPNVSQEFYKPGSRDVKKDSSLKSYSKDDGVKHGHVQGAVLHPETDKRLKENQDGTPYQAHNKDNTPSKTDSESKTSDDGVKHGHTQGAVLHPETDRRLKENRDKEPTESKDAKDDGVKHGHVKGAVLHPETDKRLKENQDGATYQAEAGKQSHKNGTSYDQKHGSYESISNDESYELVEEHENKNGAYTMVYRNKDTDYHVVFPNVSKSDSDDSKKSTERKDDDGVKHGHTQGAVLHPETDKRLKENRDKETSESKDTSDKKDETKGHTQGAVKHPESDKRLKENQDGTPYQVEAGKGNKKE